MAKMFGKATISVDGQQLLVSEDSKLNLGGVKRNTVKGNGVYGYAEEAMEATVEAHAYIDSTASLDLWNGISDATILFQCDTGQTYVLPHAWLADPVEATAANNGGKATLKFAAASAEAV